MMVAGVVMGAISRMRCARCGQIMGQGERERNPSTPDGQPIHQECTMIEPCVADYQGQVCLTHNLSPLVDVQTCLVAREAANLEIAKTQKPGARTWVVPIAGLRQFEITVDKTGRLELHAQAAMLTPIEAVQLGLALQDASREAAALQHRRVDKVLKAGNAIGLDAAKKELSDGE